MLEGLKKQIYDENIALVKAGLIVLTWGNARRIPDYLINKHYFRKHGKNAYCGQK